MKQTSHTQFPKRIGTLLLSSTLVLSLCSMVVLACSGDGAPALIEHNRSIVRLYAVISAACLLASIVLFFLRRRKGLWVVLINIFFLVLHPVWSYGSRGDCGMSIANGAQFSSVLVAIGTAYQLRAWLIARNGNRDRA